MDGVAVVEYLKGLWRELLGVEDLPVDVSFFSLGGNSMLAIRMLVSVSSTFDRELDLDRFFAVPSLTTLSQLILSDGRAGTAAGGSA